MKKYIFLAVSALTLASCQTDDFLGDTPGNNPSYAQKAISFGGTTGKISRATGAAAADALRNNFIVFGTKTVGDKTSVVYNYYNVNWKTSEGTNEGAWVYEGEEKSLLNNFEGNQSLKYWDYAATKYDFVAFSLAGNTMGDGGIKVEKVADQNYPTYTLKGKVSALRSCYIADPVSGSPNNFQDKVQFTFRSPGTKVSVGIYETIPGYSIQNITFYKADETTTSDQPVLYASSTSFPSSEGTGTLTLIFDKTPTTQQLVAENTETETKNLEFDSFTCGQDKYLSTDRNDPTRTGSITVSPIEIKDGLNMKTDYTLISDDGSGETITVTGATVKISPEYTNLQSNYHYTYIFKITDKTNGSTGGAGGTTGLNPIVFDAIITEDFKGTQKTETIFKEDGTGTTTPEGGTTEDITNGGN